MERSRLTVGCLLALLCAVVGSVPLAARTRKAGARNTEDGLLPGDVTPSHYNLELQPDFYQPAPPFTFQGSVEVFITCVQSTNEIVLNVRWLNITSIEIHVDPTSPGSPPSPILNGWTINADAEFLTVSVVNALEPGAKYYTRIAFNGVLDNSLNGLYYESYVDTDGTTKYIAATQMQSIEARKAFPCFDEPAFKASYNITVVSRPPMVTLSNMNLLRTEDRSDGWVAHIFAQSPVMSTYHVCIIVGDLISVEAEWQGVTAYPVHIYARPQMAGSLSFAAKYAPQFQAWLEQETGIPYSLPKMDHVALPRRGGAMENWGIITYEEYYLVVNPETSGAIGKFTVSTIVSHEISHQWYGNLVTCKWWNDIWLNEGFATYYNYYPQEIAGFPTTEPQLSDERRGIQQFLDVDQLNTSDPIIKVIDTVWKADYSFDGSTYPKGGAMVLMLRSILSLATMKRGFTKYLTKYSYSSTTTDDLWAELTAQAAIDGIRNPDGSALDVKSRMDAWLNQMGYPVVAVTRTGSTTARVDATRFFNPRGQTADIPSDYNYLWNIPITIATASTSNWDMRPSQWINFNSTSATITGVPTYGNWMIINAQQKSFFRVNYDSSFRSAIVSQLNSAYSSIPPESRSQFIDDSFALARTLTIDETLAMDTTVYLTAEGSPSPWFSAIKHFGYADRILTNYASLHPNFRTYVTNRLVAEYNRIGWNFPDTESPFYQTLRRSILVNTCLYGYGPCLTKAAELYANYSANPDVYSIHADQLPAALCTGVSQGTSTDWSMAFDQYQKRKSSPIREERYTFLFGMACSTDATWLDRLLNYIVLGEIPSRDQNQALTYLIQNNLGVTIVWNYFDNSWTTVPSTINKLSALRKVIKTFYDAAGKTKFDNFLSKYPASSDNELQQFRQNSLIIQQNIDWITTNEASLATWLSQHVPRRSAFQLQAPTAMSPVDYETMMSGLGPQLP